MSLVNLTKQLTDFSYLWLNKPLEYGLWDCAQMVRAWVKQRTDRDLMADCKPYATKKQARISLKEFGYDSLTNALDAMLPQIEVGQAFIGDIVEIKSNTTGFRTALTIKTSDVLFLMFTENGVLNIGINDQLYKNGFALTGKAWKVG